MDFLIIIVLCGILGFLIWEKFILPSKNTEFEQKNMQNVESELAALRAEMAQKNQKIGELKNEIEKERSDKDILSGKGKQAFQQIISLDEQKKQLQRVVEDSQKKIVQFESHKEQFDKNMDKKITDLEESRKSLEDEKYRVRKQDDDRKIQYEEMRNRVWVEHENKVLSLLREVCQKPSLSFAFFENTNLPEGFEGKFKPDFLVEFLGQYIIFDAKMTKPDSNNPLQNYIKAQVKSTAKKIKEAKNTEALYKTVFFVVPRTETIKETHFYEEGIEFFVISAESIEPILYSFKKILYYDQIESIDPLERENIVHLIAAYDHHVSYQNAVHILSSMMGVKIAELKETLASDMKSEVENKKKKIRLDNFKPTDLKRLINNPNEQFEAIKKMIQPQNPEVETQNIEDVQEALF